VAIGQGRALYDTLACNKSYTIKKTFRLVISGQQWKDFLCNLLFRVQHFAELLGHLTSRVAFKDNSFTHYRAFWWSHQFNLGMVAIASTHNHAFRHNVSELSRLQVSKHHTQAFSHLLDWNKLLKTRSNCAQFALPQIYFLDVKLSRFGMSCAFNNSTHTQVS
jgi:hypothetical protein